MDVISIKNIIVYGSTMEKAFNKLQELLDNMKPEDIRKITKAPSSGIFTVKLNNGDYYQAIRANDGARGYRWQYAYIDRDINQELLDCVVICKFIPENLNPNTYIEDYYEWY